MKELGAEVTVLRNDAFHIGDLEAYDKIILSPGPGIPSEAGLLLDVIRTYAGRKPILGVCLGEQAIGEVFGARLVNLSEVFHGVQTPVNLAGDVAASCAPASGMPNGAAPAFQMGEDYIFNGLPASFPVGRYHSWVVDSAGLPECLEVTAVSGEGYIMALRHKEFDVHGIQFHPESVLTPDGKTIVANFLNHE